MELTQPTSQDPIVPVENYMERTVFVGFRFPTKINDALKLACKKTTRTKSNYVLNAVMAQLSRDEIAPPQ